MCPRYDVPGLFFEQIDGMSLQRKLPLLYFAQLVRLAQKNSYMCVCTSNLIFFDHLGSK
jgi:hypothetical protein